MLRFLIYSPWGYNEASYGIWSLHRLADVIGGLIGKENVWVWTEGARADYQYTQVYPGTTLLTDWQKDTVVVYPEIINGNPMGAKYVVRWLLNTPGALAGDESTYGKNELVYNFHPYYVQKDMTNYKGVLSAYQYQHGDFAVIKDIIPWNSRTDSCYCIRKGVGKVYNWHPDNSICIDGWETKGRKWLIETFGRCSTFISYDHLTFLSQLAALCGCLSIIVPDSRLSKKDFHEKFATTHFGIAYGLDDVGWAFGSQHLVEDNLKSLVDVAFKQTEIFVEDCRKLINQQ